MKSMPLFRSIVCLLLIQGILSSTLLVPIAYIDFELRKEYIAKVLCINREKVEIGCNGQCFLMKRLNRANEQCNSESRQIEERFQLTFFKQVIMGISIDAFPNLPVKEFAISDVCETLSSHTGDIFHPPQFSI